MRSFDPRHTLSDSEFGFSGFDFLAVLAGNCFQTWHWTLSFAEFSSVHRSPSGGRGVYIFWLHPRRVPASVKRFFGGTKIRTSVPEIKEQIDKVKRAAKEMQIPKGKKAGRGFGEIKKPESDEAAPAKWTCHPGRMAFSHV